MQEPVLSEQAQQLPLGTYRHFKGNLYNVLGVALHSETLEEMVVYQAQYGDNRIWVRPLALFVSTKEVDGEEIPRFTHLPNGL